MPLHPACGTRAGRAASRMRAVYTSMISVFLARRHALYSVTSRSMFWADAQTRVRPRSSNCSTNRSTSDSSPAGGSAASGLPSVVPSISSASTPEGG